MERLAPGQAFAFVEPSETGTETTIRGQLLGPSSSEPGAYRVEVDEVGLRRRAVTHWSGRMLVLPLEAT